MNVYFPQPKSLGGRVKVELNLSNYSTITDLGQRLIYHLLLKRFT